MLIASLLFAAALQAAAARPDPQTLGPKVGETLPPIEAMDQNGRTQDFASLKGPNGLVFVFFRSADW